VRVYIAGPMTGIRAFNFPAFDSMAITLRRMGHEVICPSELDDPESRAAAMASVDGDPAEYARLTGLSWGDFLSRDVKVIADGGIDAIVVLDGWEKSRGARLETFVGKALCGIPVQFVVPYYGGANGLMGLTDLALYRAWAAEPTLAIHGAYGVTA
jgi:hypothetical protein